MKTKFYGSSDDLVEIEGDIPMLNGPDKGSGRAEWSGTKSPMMFCIVGPTGKCLQCGEPTSPQRLASILAFYEGVWFFALKMIDDGKPIPKHWEIKTVPEHDYSTALTIDTGDDEVWILAPWYKGEDE